MRYKILICVLLLSSIMVAAQHNAKIGFTPGVPTGTQGSATSWKLYRSLSDTGPFTNVGTCTTVSPYSCTDTTVLGSTTYFWYITGVTGVAESVPSAHISATIPPDTAPPPPTNLNIISVAMNNYGVNTEVYAQWTAPAGVVTNWTISDDTGKIATGTSKSALGTNTLIWNRTNMIRVPNRITVCDSNNLNCDIQQL